MHELLQSVFGHLDQENIQYCLLRDADRLDELADGGEIDILIQASQLAQLRQLLTRLAFVSLPSWGHAPHHFFIAYHQETDCWFKLDITTAVIYGGPVPSLSTELAAVCLSDRRRSGSTYMLSPECELVTLLLHCLLDKGNFSPVRGQRLQALLGEISDERFLTTLLADYWLPTMTWSELAALVAAGNWSALLAERKRVAARLSERDRVGTISRSFRGRVLRKLNVWVNARRPRSLTVALLAPDGAGKSTLVQGLQDSFYFPVQSIYMGLYQKGNSGLTNKSAPGLGLVLRLGRQWTRYLVARYHQARRRLVIFDRYTYDARLPSRQRLNGLKRARRWLLAHSCPAPDLVIMLDVPGKTLYARKGEHSAEFLEQQRQNYLKLQPHLPQMVVVDATRDANCVRREVIALIWRGYQERQLGSRVGQMIGASVANG